MRSEFSIDNKRFQVTRLDAGIEVWEGGWVNYLFLLPGSWTDHQVQVVLEVYCKGYAHGSGAAR